MEKDDEVRGSSGSFYTTEFRGYDPLIGHWISPDPVEHHHLSPYNAFDNNPIFFKDPKGSNSEKGNDKEKKKTTTDAGHGIDGSNNPKVDPGTIDGEHLEKDYALKVEEKVAYWLEEMGVDNQRTREADITIDKNSINYRWKKANENGSDVFVSIHLNSGDKEGMFVVISNRKGRQSGDPNKLAQSIIDNSVTLKPRSSNDIVSLTKFIQYFKGDAAVIIELGGIGNEKTRNLINTKASDIGKEIATGVYKYMYGKAPDLKSEPAPATYRLGKYCKNQY